MSYERELKAATAAAHTAGRYIRFHSGRIAQEAVRDKGRHDLVTAADEEAQEAIIEVLQRHCPAYEILAEESGADKGAHVPEGRRWIIDPIDGTTNFTHAVPPYAVSIALQDREELVLGVVLDVSRGELFTAVRGGGVYVNGTPARVSATAPLEQALLTTGFPYREFAHIDQYLAVFRQFMQKAQGIRRPGSAAIDLAYVACGRFDGFFETGLYPWDIAAGIVLIEEGGGRVTNYWGEGDILFDKHILASNGHIHEEMEALLRAEF